MSGWGLPYHHFKRSEKFLSFAVKRIMSEKRKRETCSPQTFGHRLIYICGARVLSYNGALETISLSFMPLSPSNLRPFGAPPSIGRRECPREPLPLEGAAERSEAGLASFFGGARVLSQTAYLRRSFPLFFIPLEPYPARFARHLPHTGKAVSVVILFLHICVYSL